MTLSDLVEREIARNEEARNGMALFGALLAAIALIVWAVRNPLWPLPAAVAGFFLLVATHAEYLRRRLIRGGRDKIRDAIR